MDFEEKNDDLDQGIPTADTESYQKHTAVVCRNITLSPDWFLQLSVVA